MMVVAKVDALVDVLAVEKVEKLVVRSAILTVVMSVDLMARR